MHNRFTADKATVAPGNEIPPRSTTAEHSVASLNGNNGEESAAQRGVFNQPSSYYHYYYPDYNLSYGQSNHGSNQSSTGLQADQSSIAYYMPAYNPYQGGAFVGADGCCVRPPYCMSSGYFRPPETYTTTSPTTHRLYDPSVVTTATMTSDPKLYNSDGSQPKFGTRPLKPSIKPGSNFQSASNASAYRPAGNFQSLPSQMCNPYPNNRPMGFRPNPRIWNSNYDNRISPNRNGGLEIPNELKRGPRIKRSSNSSNSEAVVSFRVKKEKYNTAVFPTDYQDAKFYVIKSYSEDHVNKSLKYDVWSSTAYGNKKLDSAFHDAEIKIRITGVKCPIFLFFSVNASGQFVGVAEMLDRVDFNKSMNFWHLHTWSGFFPVQWHIVKDVPNSQLRHILLENNENRPVTFTRDTHEIGLKQGLEMLRIFKNYLSKTSLLDDFEFYEDREKALQNQRSGKQPGEICTNVNLQKQPETVTKVGEVGESQGTAVMSLAELTEILTLD